MIVSEMKEVMSYLGSKMEVSKHVLFMRYKVMYLGSHDFLDMVMHKVDHLMFL